MASRLKKTGRIGAAVLAVGGAATAVYLVTNKRQKQMNPLTVVASEVDKRPTRVLPSRAEQIQSLKTEQFDVLVIGGGATGSGCALDASSRGLKTAMVELDDFSSGTSSRSTKLIHGGVRYLQKAIMNLDYDQYKMVKEALHERKKLVGHRPPPLVPPAHHAASIQVVASALLLGWDQDV